MMLDAKIGPRFLLEMVATEAKRFVVRRISYVADGFAHQWVQGGCDDPDPWTRFGVRLARVVARLSQ